MKNRKLSKILGIGLSLMLVFSLGLVFTAAPVAADEDEWSTYDIPLQGEDGDWFMDDAITLVGPIVRDIDDYFWAYVEQGTGNDEIYKSLDTEGRTWELTMYSDAADGVEGQNVLAMVPSTLDADVLYAIDAAEVYKTDDGGDTWAEVGDFDTDVNKTLTTLAVGWDSDDDARVFVGLADSDTAGHDVAADDVDATGTTEGIYYLYDIAFGTDWTDLALDISADGDRLDSTVLGLAVSPDFEDDAFIAALVTNHEDGDTHVAWHVGSNPGGWTSVDLEDAGGDDWESDFGSDPVFPADFNGDDFADDETSIYVGYSDIADADGGVSEVYGTADDAEQQLDDIVGTNILSLSGVGTLGSMQFLAGESEDNDVWYSSDDGDNFEQASVEGIQPSGTSNTHVLIDADYDEDEGIGWAAVEGAEGGLSMTIDGGISWQGISLLDTDIDALNAAAIVGDTVYILTALGAESDLFRYDGAWTRLYQEAQYALGDMVQIGIFDDTIVLCETAGTNIAFSDDGGQIFAAPDEEPTDAIITLLVLEDELWWVGDTNGDLWVTDDAGNRIWDEYEIDSAGVADITSLAVSGDTALAGTSISEAWYSEDEGETWDQVDTAADIDGDNAATYVTFDSDDANIAYAAVDGTIARFTDLGDLDGDWEAWDFMADQVALFADTASDNLTFSGIASVDGVLYVSDDEFADTDPDTTPGTDDAEGGLWRSVNPLEDMDAADVDESDWDWVTDGLEVDGTENFDGLLVTDSNVLWAFDTTLFTLWTYEDLLIGPVTGITTDPGDTSVTLEWGELSGNATDWEVRVYENEDMTAAYELYDSDTADDDPVARLDGTVPPVADATAPDAGTQYWVQVRASAPVHSKWSAVSTFTTNPGAMGIDEDTLAPSLGALNVSTDTPFSWGFNADADSYTIEISDTANFSNILDSATVTVPAYQSSVTLSEGTNYWFRVWATAGTQDGDPAYSNFTTLTTPPAPPAPAAPAAPGPTITIPPSQTITPNWIYAIIAIGAGLAGFVIYLIVKTRRP